jgi:hypothetical protein
MKSKALVRQKLMSFSFCFDKGFAHSATSINGALHLTNVLSKGADLCKIFVFIAPQ